MISIDEMEEMLNEISEELPEDFYKELNGGIILLPEKKLHADSIDNDLYVLGEYHKNNNLGRFISIYYGSFEIVYGHLSNNELKEKLMNTLKHEFRHHLESLGGERDLEIEDEKSIAKYKENKDKH